MPSHVAPEANDTPPPPLPEPPSAEIKVAVASVQLIEDCPELAPAAAASARKPVAASLPGPSVGGPAGRSQQQGDAIDDRHYRHCTQSTVQLSVRSDVLGPFRIEAIRVLDPKSQRAAGAATLREPTRWSDSMYSPWDGQVDVKTELKISYKLGALDLTRAAELVGPDFNTYMGPFVLELDVSVDGHRQTIRSAEFGREPPHIMVT